MGEMPPRGGGWLPASSDHGCQDQTKMDCSCLHGNPKYWGSWILLRSCDQEHLYYAILLHYSTVLSLSIMLFLHTTLVVFGEMVKPSNKAKTMQMHVWVAEDGAYLHSDPSDPGGSGVKQQPASTAADPSEVSATDATMTATSSSVDEQWYL